MTNNDIVDQIDALIDEQLDAGEPETGYSYGNPSYPKCWHCGRHEHFLPITERIDAMYRRGQFDEDYFVAEDDSRVLCRGSEFIGPMPAWGVEGVASHLGVIDFDALAEGCSAAMREWQEFATTLAANMVRQLGVVLGIPEAATDGMNDQLTRMLSLPNPFLPDADPLLPATHGRERWWRTTLPDGARISENSTGWFYTIHVGGHTYLVPGEHFLLHEHAVVDVLAESAPNIGGTWEPITAPGVTTHPDAQPQTPRTHGLGRMLTYGPQFQQLALTAPPHIVYTAEGTGEYRTAIVSAVEHDEDTGETTITAHTHAPLVTPYLGLAVIPTFTPTGEVAEGFEPLGVPLLPDDGDGTPTTTNAPGTDDATRGHGGRE